MKPKTTIILVAALLLAIVYAVVRYTDLFKRGTPATVAGKKLLDLPGREFGNVATVSVRRAGGGAVAFAKKDTAWQIVQPIRAKADEYTIGDLASTLGLLKIDRALAGEAKDAQPAITGLDKPAWTVTVTDDKGNTRTLRVGSQPPLSPTRTYVTLEGNTTVYVVEADLPSLLEKPLKDYRSKSVLSLPAQEIVRLTVAGHESYTLVRDKGAWSSATPLAAPLEAAKVQELLGKIANLAASDFIEDQPRSLAPYGLDHPRLTVRAFVQPPAPVTTRPATAPATKPAETCYAVALGNVVKDKVFAKLLDEPSVFQLDAGLLEGLQPKLADLREKQVLNVATAMVTGISIHGPEGQAALAQSPEGWRMTAPFPGKANGEAVVALLEALRSLKADNFRDEPVPAAGLENPAATLTLTVGEKGKESSVSLRIGATTPSGEMTFVRKDPAGSVAVVKTADLKPLLTAPAGYWDNKIFTLPTDGRITALTLRRPGETTVLVRGQDGTWAMEQPLRSAVDAAAVNKALDLLERVTAGKIVAFGDKLPAKYAAAKESLTAELTVETAVAPPAPASQPATATALRPATAPASGPSSAPAVRTETVTLHLVRLDNAVYAWRDGLPIVAVGELAASAYADLSAEMRNRSVLRLLAADVDAVTITAGQESLRLVREKGTWTYPADPYVKIDGEKVAAFLDQFKDVQAEKFVGASGANPAAFGLQAPAVVFECATKSGVKRLSLAPAGPAGAKTRYAQAAGVEGVFVVGADLPDKLAKGLKDFKQ